MPFRAVSVCVPGEDGASEFRKVKTYYIFTVRVLYRVLWEKRSENKCVVHYYAADNRAKNTINGFPCNDGFCGCSPTRLNKNAADPRTNGAIYGTISRSTTVTVERREPVVVRVTGSVTDFI